MKQNPVTPWACGATIGSTVGAYINGNLGSGHALAAGLCAVALVLECRAVFLAIITADKVKS